MNRSVSRMVAVMIGLPLLGCAAEHQEVALSRPCDVVSTRQALVARRASLRADMKRDVDLGQDGGVPGRSFDDQSTRNADAYVRRVKENWGNADRSLGNAIREIDRQSLNVGCRTS